MKKFLFLSLLSCSASFAENQDIEHSNSGFYFGAALESSRDSSDFCLTASTLGTTDYQSVDFSKQNWSFSPQIVCGYKGEYPFFYALELALSLNKNKVFHTFPLAEGEHPLNWPANLRIDNGNTLSFRLKIGKNFSYWKGYAIVGAYTRKLQLIFDYMATGDDPDEDAARLRSGSSKSKNFVRPLVGFGFGLHFGHGLEINAEYCYMFQGNISLQHAIDRTIDREGYPRSASLKNKQHSLSIQFTVDIPSAK